METPMGSPYGTRVTPNGTPSSTHRVSQGTREDPRRQPIRGELPEEPSNVIFQLNPSRNSFKGFPHRKILKGPPSTPPWEIPGPPVEIPTAFLQGTPVEHPRDSPRLPLLREPNENRPEQHPGDFPRQNSQKTTTGYLRKGPKATPPETPQGTPPGNAPREPQRGTDKGTHQRPPKLNPRGHSPEYPYRGIPPGDTAGDYLQVISSRGPVKEIPSRGPPPANTFQMTPCRKNSPRES